MSIDQVASQFEVKKIWGKSIYPDLHLFKTQIKPIAFSCSLELYHVTLIINRRQKSISQMFQKSTQNVDFNVLTKAGANC